MHKNIPIRKIAPDKDGSETRFFIRKLDINSEKAKNVEPKKRVINGDFKIILLMATIVLMASVLFNSFNDCITKKEKAKYTPPIKPKLAIANHSK